MKRKFRIYFAMIITMILFRIILIPSTIAAKEIDNTTEVSQEYIYMFINYQIWPFATTLGTNVIFEINFEPGPLNLSVYKNLVSAKYVMTSYVIPKKFVTNLYLNFDSNSNNIDATADKISQEFLKTFNHTLDLLYKNGPVFNNETKKTEVYYQFGALLLTTETALDFLKYKPGQGFAELANEQFLSMYIQENVMSNITDLKYTYERDHEHLWNFVVEVAMNEILEDFRDNTKKQFIAEQKSVNLNELINNNEPIRGTNENSSFIIAQISNTTLSNEKYTINILNVIPVGCTVEKHAQESVNYRWNMNSSIDNVIINFKTDKISKSNDAVILLVIAIGIMTTITIVIQIRRRNKS